MSKTVSSGLATHLAGVVTTIAFMWRIERRDGTVFRFTNHDQDIVFNSNTYKATSGFTSSDIANSSSFSVNNLNAQAIFDSADITEADLRNGLFDYAEVRLFAVNYKDTTQGELRQLKGRIGEVQISDNQYFTAELRDLMQLMSQNIGELYAPECRTDLGDDRCKIPIRPAILGRSQAVTVGQFYRVVTANSPSNPAIGEDFENRIYRVAKAGTTAGSQPSYNKTLGETTSDGTADLIAEEAWTRHFEVIRVNSNSSFVVTELTPNSSGPRGGFPNDWFNFGAVSWDTGNNAGSHIEVKDFVADNGTLIEQTVQLFLPTAFNIQIGDKGTIYPGCDKRRITCRDKFANILNFRGEPDLPGSDLMLRFPNAKR